MSLPRRLLALAAVLVAAIALGVPTLRSIGDDRSAPDRASPAAPATTTTTTSSTTSSPPATDRPATDTCPAVPARAQPAPDRPRYDVEVSADPGTGVVEGELRVRFEPDLPVDELVFRLWPNGPRPASAGARLEVTAVVGESGPLATETPDPTTLRARLARPLGAGDRTTVTVGFRLEVPGSAQDRISRSSDSLRLGSFLPLLAWEPGVGWATEPPVSGFAEATSTPAADWSVAIGVPEGYGVLASGEQGDDGRWQLTGARDFAVSVGRFHLAEATVDAGRPVAVAVGVHDGVDADAGAYLDRVTQSLEQISATYGAYPWPTYTLALTPGLGGGIEFPGHVMQGAGTIGRTTPHEVAHMWFYGLVGNNQGRAPWLDEGLATWVEGRVEGTLDDMARRSIPAAGQGRAGEPMTYWEGRQDAYYRSVYVQPAAALAALGPPELVDCALAHYVAANAYRIATPDDLVAALELTFDDPASTLAPFGLP